MQKLCALLRIANSLDRSHKQKVKKLQVKFSPNGDAALLIFTHSNFLLEKENFLEKKELFEEITGNKLTLSLKSAE